MTTDTLTQLRDLHSQLIDHFSEVRVSVEGRSSIQYFIDHGLSSDDFESSRESIQVSLRQKTLDSAFWQSAYLPLLICTVEVGYHYQGNGTDFWPALSETLDYDFRVADRAQIATWFAKSSEKLGGVTPGDSQWEQAFCNIAWPISHAVASSDIRRPFADCLRRFERDVTNETLKDKTIVSELSRISTPVGSRRFRTWLKRHDVVAGITRDLLGGQQLHEAGLFSESFRNRLIEDLRDEAEIRKAIASVELRRKTRPRKLATGVQKSDDVEATLFGDFFLRHSDGLYELCGEMPELPRSVRRALKTVRGRWKIRPWGHASAKLLPANCLRSTRGHFYVCFREVARSTSEMPFFVGVEDQPCDEEAKRWLKSVRFPATELLAFSAMDSDGETTHCISSRTPHSGKIWVVAKGGDVQSRMAELDENFGRFVGRVQGGEIHEFDASNAIVRDWLRWPRIGTTTQSVEPSFTWLRPAPISSENDSLPVFSIDDEVGIFVQGELSLEMVVRSGNEVLGRRVVIDAATVKLDKTGEYSIDVYHGENRVDSFHFSVIDSFVESDPVDPWRSIVSHVDAGETELCRQDLFNRRLNIDFVGERGIENLSATLSLSPGDASVDVRLDRLPTRVAATHPVWKKLTSQLPDSVLKSSCDLLLSVEIDGLSKDAWRLEAALQNVWWEESNGELAFPCCDEGPRKFKRYDVIQGVQVESPIEGDPFISIAMDDEGNKLLFDGRVDVIGSTRLQMQLTPPKRFLRQLDDLGDCFGLRTITERFLQLASASSSSSAAELNRVGAAQSLKSWILHAVCGRNWIRKQQEMIGIEAVNPIKIWWDCQAGEKDLLQPPAEDGRCLPDTLPEIILHEFGNVLPDLWWDGAVQAIEADDAIPLDSIFQHLLDDDSVIVDGAALTSSIRLANERLCGGHLADLLIPAVAGDELLSWHVSEMTVSDCALQLREWIRRSLGRGRGRQNWSVDELQIWLNLLLYPERLRKQAWAAVLEKLLHDRPVARAGAFIAWRLEQNARLGSSEHSTESK